MLFALVQWTWGLLQNIVGLIVLLLMGKQKRYRYRGALVTRFGENKLFRQSGAFSLGTFIFIPDTWGDESCKRTVVHEYGHSIQSLILGPLYLPAVGLPSVLWGERWTRSKRKMQIQRSGAQTRSVSPRTERIAAMRYTSRYPENWANALGRYVTGEEPVDN